MQTADAYGYTTGWSSAEIESSAAAVVPFLCERFKPSTVVDFGCGKGTWLYEFSARGCSVLGLDGPHVPAPELKIAISEFLRVDLTERLVLNRHFDIAVCLEVAEHLRRTDTDNLLDSLTAASDVVIFGAAIPGQGGFEHVNEQYQSHWIDKFQSRGFAAYDIFRPKFWLDERVSWWYRQNTIVYANSNGAKHLQLELMPFIADVVHPSLYDRTRNPQNWSGRIMIRELSRKLLSGKALLQSR